MRVCVLVRTVSLSRRLAGPEAEPGGLSLINFVEFTDERQSGPTCVPRADVSAVI